MTGSLRLFAGTPLVLNERLYAIFVLVIKASSKGKKAGPRGEESYLTRKQRFCISGERRVRRVKAGSGIYLMVRILFWLEVERRTSFDPISSTIHGPTLSPSVTLLSPASVRRMA